jgi:hypothetical protein
MKHYCFLLLIILLCLLYNKLYDNKLYEGLYDVNEDRTVAYVDPSVSRRTNLLDEFGLGNIIPDEYIPEILRDNTVSAGNCVNKDGSLEPDTTEESCEPSSERAWFVCDIEQDCSENLQPDDMNWAYNTDNTPEWHNTNKRKCVECLKCKDGHAFIESFYGHACDAIVGCLDDVSNYNKDILPYVYAYKNSDWPHQCSGETNVLRAKTCEFAQGYDSLDALALLVIDRTASCHLSITALEAEVAAAQFLRDHAGGL